MDTNHGLELFLDEKAEEAMKFGNSSSQTFG